METDQAVDLVRQALWMMLVLSSPILLAGLAIGLVVSILQAVTQIQEQTLSFVPKMVVMGLVAILITPWIAHLLMDFSEVVLAGY